MTGSACDDVTPGSWRTCLLNDLPIVPDVLEEIEGLLQPVCMIVFSDHHVVTATGHHKDNGRHICFSQTHDTHRHTHTQTRTRKYFITPIASDGLALTFTL